MAYYFLVAQLPYLTYGQQPPMTTEAFLGLCAASLSKADAELLAFCTLGVNDAEEPRPTGSAFVDAWRRRERTLTLNLAQARAAKQKREVPAEPPHDPPDADVQARAAFAMENPLEAELFIDKGRWDALETLTGTDYFGVNTVYAYLLKLRLMERRASFKTEEGFAEYKALYAGILEGAPRARS